MGGQIMHGVLVALCVVLAIFFQAVGFVWGELVRAVGSFRAYLDHKLMDLPNDPAAKALLLEKGRDLGREFGEKYLMIRTSKRQTG